MKFMGLVKYIVGVYVGLRRRMRRCCVRGSSGWCIDLNGSGVLRFRSCRELVEYIKSNPRIIEELGDGAS